MISRRSGRDGRVELVIVTRRVLSLLGAGRRIDGYEKVNER